MEEIYKDIHGYEGRYAVSNLGNVKSLRYQNTYQAKVLTPVKHHLGYLFVHLGKDKIKMIHTLVAETFIPNPDGKPFVNHIDGDKTNNVVSNLEWVTSKENMEHAIRTGLRDPRKNNHPSGPANHSSKPILQLDKDGNVVKEWLCISEAARAFKCNPCLLINCAAGRTKTARGFVWRHPSS